MRGDLSLQLRMLARPHGVAGLAAGVAGALAVTATYLPWYDVTARVDLLGTPSRRVVASLAAWQAHPWGWLVAALGLVAVVAGVMLAVDRPLGPGLLLWPGIGLAGTVVLGGLLFPPVSRFDVAGSPLRELTALADRMPRNVDMTFAVRPAVGLWLTLAAATLVVAAGLASRERA